MAQECTEQYLISDAARQVEVETHVLRYWEEELKLPIQRNKLGHRYYTKEDVERFRIIKRWKEQGLQLKAIRNALKDPKGSIWSMMQAELGQEKTQSGKPGQEQTEEKQQKQSTQKEDKQKTANINQSDEETGKEGDNKMVRGEAVKEETVRGEAAGEEAVRGEAAGEEAVREEAAGEEAVREEAVRKAVPGEEITDKEDTAETQASLAASPENPPIEKHIHRSSAKGKGRRTKKNRQKVSVVRWDSKRAEAALEKLDLRKQPDTKEPDTKQEVVIHIPDAAAERTDFVEEAVTEEKEIRELEIREQDAVGTENQTERLADMKADKLKARPSKQQAETEEARQDEIPEKEEAKQQESVQEDKEAEGQETTLSGDTVRTAEVLAEEEKNRKAARFQFLLSQMMKEAVRSNNEDLIASVQELVAKEMDFQFRQQEEREQEREQQRLKREEEHYKKIDELLRTRSGQAADRKKKRPLFGWN